MRNTRTVNLWPAGIPLILGLIFLLGFLFLPAGSAADLQAESSAGIAEDATGGGPKGSDESVDETPDEDADLDDSDWESSKNDVVRMGESIEVDADEIITGDVVAIGGSVVVFGRVKGDVVAVGGGIELKSGCVVDGDVVSVGGPIEREEGAIVKGQNVKVGSIPGGLWWLPKGGKHGLVERDRECPSLSGSTFAKGLVSYIGLFLCGLVFFLAFPKRGMVVRSTLRSRFWLSLLAGIGSMVAAAVILILLCITCIGILVAIPGFIVIMLIILASGAVAVGAFGEVLLRREVKDSNSWIGTFAIGLAVLFAVNIVGWLFCSVGVSLLGKILLSIVKAAWFVFLAVGFGSLVLSRWGAQNPAEPTPIPSWIPAGDPGYVGGAPGGIAGTGQGGSSDWGGWGGSGGPSEPGGSSGPGGSIGSGPGSSPPST